MKGFHINNMMWPPSWLHSSVVVAASRSLAAIAARGPLFFLSDEAAGDKLEI
jgi:hypothetical protein